MKYVAVADEDPVLKRGRGEAKATEQGQAFVIFPRGDAVRIRPRNAPQIPAHMVFC